MNNEYFYSNKSNGADGFHTWCKTCSRKKAKKVRDDNIDVYRERTYQHYQVNKDQYDVRRNDWMKENKEHFKEYHKEYVNENKEYFLQYHAERRLHKSHEIDNEEWENCLKYFYDSCAYCGITEDNARLLYKKRLNKEHVDHEGANDLSNAIPACTGCNSSKWAHPMEEWYRKMSFFDEEKLIKIHKWLSEDYKKFIRRQ